MHKGLFAAVTLSLCIVAATIVEGHGRVGKHSRPARLTESVVLADYGGNWATYPDAINNRGQIAGWALSNDGQWVAFVRSPRGKYTAIAERAFAYDINDRGEVVGILFPCDASGCRFEGFVWSAERGLQNLGSFLPLAINDDGDMAGICQLRQACVMRGGTVSAITGPGSEARGINANGDVVGQYGDNRGFHFSTEGQFTDIGRAVASDINDRGVIAGHRWTVMPERGERAMVTAWTEDGPLSPALEVGVAIALNKKAWVIAYGFDENERYFTYIWNPATNARVMLESADGGYVQLGAINDHGDVVGSAGPHGAIWRVRKKDLAAEDR
jgi:uncharacterized membrane protein